MKKYLAILMVLSGVGPANAIDSSIQGEIILVEGEIIASHWADDNYTNWHFVVKYEGRIWKCDEKGSYISCKKMGGDHLMR